MIETIASVVSILAALFALIKWARKPILEWVIKLRWQYTIPVDLSTDQIALSDEQLEKLYTKILEAVHSGKTINIVVSQKNKLWKLPWLAPREKHKAEKNIVRDKSILYIWQRSFTIMFSRTSITKLETYLHKKAEFVAIARGVTSLFRSQKLSGSKLDLWRESFPKIYFGIYPNEEEMNSILNRYNIDDKKLLLAGPYSFFANELPREIIINQVFPRLYHEIATYKNSLSDDNINDALVISSYSVGLG
jgi:hypothetical protein